MKVLFVCRANIGRSQMAAAFYHQLRPGMAGSAGTVVDMPGQSLRERIRSNAVDTMQELNIDISASRRTQLTQEMLEDYDHIVVLAEPESIPVWLRNNPKVERWDVEDSKNKSPKRTREIRDEIRSRVNDLDHRLNAHE